MKDIFNLDLEEIDDYDVEGIDNIEKISINDIAVIGMSAKFPLAETIEEFWSNLTNKKDCIRKVPENRWIDMKNYLDYMNMNNYEIEEGGFLDEIDKFDYSFFGISPKEASLMDPNQRMFLQAAWQAIEDAGYGNDKIYGTRTGVYLGFGVESGYSKLISDVTPNDISLSTAGNLSPIIASRIAYLLNLRGPNMIINTACSSSLVAINLACQSLISGECSMAIVGGVQSYVLPIRKVKIGIEAGDNRAKTFDYFADGTGGGEGVGALLLKPLGKALKDKDNIHAVIKGCAVNYDGKSNGITAPNAVAQEDVIVKAWEKAAIDPETVSYIEAHGTGTKLGDPIEVDGISRAFKRFTDKKQFCAIGSVKSNVGHLDNAAGIVGVIKSILCLENKILPQTLHFTRPNKNINFIDSPIYVNSELKEWKSPNSPRRCGVSSFSLSGTNCHIVLEEHINEIGDNVEDNYILSLSAKAESVLKELIKKYKQKVLSNENLNLGEMCFTSNTGRWNYNHRIAITFKDRNELIEKLQVASEQDMSHIENNGVFYGKVLPNNIEKNLDSRDEMKSIIDSNSRDKNTLKRIASLYVNGIDVEWDEFYKNKNYKKVSLPVYPFKKDRCWVKIPKFNLEDSEEVNDLFSEIKWINVEIPKNINRLDNGKVLIISDSNKYYEDIQKEFTKNKVEVIFVKVGKEFEKIDCRNYIVNTKEEDYMKLLDSIEVSDIKLIIHMMNTDYYKESQNIDELNEIQKKGIYSLLYLVKSIGKCKLEKYPDLTVVTKYSYEVTGNEEFIQCENALISGLMKSIMWEYPYFKVKTIDFDNFTNMEFILGEIQSDSMSFEVAYRNSQKYVPVLNKVDIKNIDKKSVKIKENGTYMITGGVGRIGLEMAKYLASKNKCNIILLNRSLFPSKDKWQELIKNSKDEKLVNNLKQISEIESLGANIECLSADITKYSEAKSLIEHIREKYGNINGIIHAAGVGVGIKGNTLENENEEVFNAVLSPKVNGTWVLNNLTESDDMDFFVLCSSAITLIGGVNSGCYIAANAYLDSFASYRSRKGKKTISINWSAWNKDHLIEMADLVSDKQIFNPILPKNAIEAFDKVLNLDLSRIVIGSLNLNGSLFDMGDYLPFKISEEIKEKVKLAKNNSVNSKYIGDTNNKIKLVGRSVDKYSEIEKVIATIWQKVLGFEELSIHDNFFEIGGDSISVTKVHSLIDKQYTGKLKLVDLFAYPTIEKLSEFIMESESNEVDLVNDESKPSSNDIDDLLDMLTSGEVTIEDAMGIYNGINEGK
ncbi:type I polyketide synthase [Clostridium botulinum]|uniref:type I polyketide synthase n=1 Tax=Clostridium botulinum TaxID=1491 RepID=UPI00196716E0|nr:SDR family NAD(P)-dependent oxidoreductase [Clostridium botulinum]MBN1050266.1 SDR family NAD(P)-dependent oxidoreductase [Clostridium botulinum]